MKDSSHPVDETNITTALLLAAGTGSRLRPLTLDAPKCLTEVGGNTILGRLVNSLRSQGITRLVVVTGYLDHCVREFLQDHAADMKIYYVFNTLYQTTNNIYSLWLARHAMQDPFVLLESDLVFEESMLAGMLTADKIAVSQLLPWMNGTTVELDDQDRVAAFHATGSVRSSLRYKTVNIYSLSLLSWRQITERLDLYVGEGRVGEYYEAVFAEMVAERVLTFDAVFFDKDRWYEVDSVMDLDNAEKIFGASPRAPHSERLFQRLGVDIAESVPVAQPPLPSVYPPRSQPSAHRQRPTLPHE